MANSKLQRPNVVFIGTDQMRQDLLGCYGNQICKTPNIDKLAKEGTIFTNAYTNCTLCTPARASIFTGKYAFNHGMLTNCDMYHSVSKELTNPDELLHYKLQEKGYDTIYLGKWHVGTELGPGDYGFKGLNIPGYGDLKKEKKYQDYLKENDLSFGPVQAPIYGNPDENTLLAGKWNGPEESTPTYFLAEQTRKLLQKYASKDAPFFLSCQFWAPHPPYLPAPEYVNTHNREDILPWKNFTDDFTKKPTRVKRLVTDFYRSLPEDWEQWREIVGLYYDFTAMLDKQIGHILETLKKLNLMENTIIILTSDHGDNAGSHGGHFDKALLYQEDIKIPLIIYWPDNLDMVNENDDLIYNMDVIPSILDLLNIPAPGIDAQSFIPLIDNNKKSKGRDSIYFEFHGLKYLYSQRALITEEGYKYIFTPGDIDEVYNLNNDPGEMNNLIDNEDFKSKIKELQTKMIRKSKALGDPLSDCISKFFGSWENLSSQPDVSSDDNLS
ncbi:MAG: sulfatase-like hydrolase/transferase [Bacillota bacterium]